MISFYHIMGWEFIHNTQTYKNKILFYWSLLVNNWTLSTGIEKITALNTLFQPLWVYIGLSQINSVLVPISCQEGVSSL